MPPTRRVSALLFGNRHKLELLAALAEADDRGVNLSLLADDQGVSSSVYYGPLRELMAAGLVRRLNCVPGDRRRWYQRADHPIWNAAGSVLAELAGVRMEAP